MPYTYNNPPEIIKELPKAAQKIWIGTFNSVLSENKTELFAIKSAWNAITKAGYKKVDDKWVI
jgi:cation transport regulator ChaB